VRKNYEVGFVGKASFSKGWNGSGPDRTTCLKGKKNPGSDNEPGEEFEN